MKSAYIIFTAIGIAIGYAAPKIFLKSTSNQKKPELISDRSAYEIDSKSDVKSSLNSGNDGTEDRPTVGTLSTTTATEQKDNAATVPSAAGFSDAKKLGSQGNLDSNNLNIEQSCLDQIRPSHVRELETMWRKKTNDFLESNDFLWNSRSSHAFNTNVYKTAIGKYKGTMQFNHNTSVAVRLNIDLSSEKDGKFQYEVFEKQGKKGVSGNSSSTFNPTEAIGTDDSKNAINVFWNNGYPDIFGPDYKYFAFKMPADLFPKQKQSLEIYGLHESLEWKSVGTVEIEKL